MARREKEFKHQLLQVYGIVEESPSNNWGVAFTRNDFNGSIMYCLRHYDLSTLENDEPKMSNGANLKDDESLDRLLYILLEMGCGDEEEINKIIDKRNSIYDLDDDPKKHKKSISIRKR